jgi:hypothetical protein
MAFVKISDFNAFKEMIFSANKVAYELAVKNSLETYDKPAGVTETETPMNANKIKKRVRYSVYVQFIYSNKIF